MVASHATLLTHPGGEPRTEEGGRPSVTVIVPVFNEAGQIGLLVRQLVEVLTPWPEHEVLVVDDGSADATGPAAAVAGARVLRHPYNKGNGAAVKRGIRAARGDVLVLLDGDGQHDPAEIPRLLQAVREYDLVVGARTEDSQQVWYRRVANAVYNRFATYITETPIPDLTSGFRAMKTSIARRFVYLLPNRFSYPSTLTIAFLRAGYSVGFVPVHVDQRAAGRSKIRPWADAGRFFLTILRIGTLFSPLRVFLPLSLFLFLLGVAYTAYTLIAFSDFRNMSVVLLVFAVMMFALGLISEQIAQLRFEHSDD